MKIVLAHDSFTQMGGAERLFEGLHRIYPESPVYTLVLDKKFKEKYKNWKIKKSWLQFFYNFVPKLQYLFPFIPLAVNSLKVEECDVLISSSSSFIKNIKKPKDSIHINYCHTPTRFLWSEPNYINQEAPIFLRGLVKMFIKWMKKWDFNRAQKIDFFIANSKEVQNRIKEFYKRDSEIIYPFIDTSFWRTTLQKKDYFLIAGRLQAHKNNEMVINLFNELNLPLHVDGAGRQEKYLKSIAGPNIKFSGRLGDKELRDEYSGALALIYPQIEDFGLMPIEAAACGTPAIGLAKGGSLETILQGKTGEHFKDFADLKNTILNFDYKKYLSEDLKNHANNFSFEKFKTSILGTVQKDASETRGR
jgi:glycosyltransferase involved in cell wall biosynthesis